jgi:3-hydroxyacyl-[acyl-carrier-protein] dehydratase
MRWLWIDRFVEFESGKSARAVKNLSRAEDVFRDHFPGWPVMPATLLLEGLAQTGGILVGEARKFQEKVVLAKIGQASFRREALAGEQLTYEVEIVELRAEGASIRGRVLASEEPIAFAEIMFAHLDQSRSNQIFGEKNFVFSGELGKMLGLSKLLGQDSAAANKSAEC